LDERIMLEELKCLTDVAFGESRIPSAHLRQVHKGRPQIGREKQLRSAKIGLRHSQDCVGILVDLDHAATTLRSLLNWVRQQA
jgi:hypothetical protein